MTEDLMNVAGDSARSGFFLISGAALSTVILAISSIIIARYLGPDLYGQYTLAFATPTLIFLFADLGIDQGIIKFTASLRAKGGTTSHIKIIQHGLLLRAAIGIAIFITSYSLAEPFASLIIGRPDLVFYVRIASIGVLFQTLCSTAINSFVGLDKSEYSALTSNIQAIAKTIIQIILVLLGFSVAGALIGHLAGYILAAGVGISILLFLLRHEQNVQTGNSIAEDPRIGNSLREDVETLVHYGTPLYISVILGGFVPVYQNLMLGIYATYSDVGNFRAATNFATLITVITAPIVTTLLPAFSKLDSSTKTKIRLFFKLANKYTAMLVLPVMMLIIIFSSEIIQIVYGSTFQSAQIFLSAYCLLYLLVGLGYLTLSSFYNGLGETKTTLRIGLITFVAFVILSPILTKTYSVIGSIAALIIANTASTLYGTYVSRARFRIEFDTKSMVKIYLISILSSIPPLVLLQFSRQSQLFNVATGALLYLLTYATLVPVTGTLDYSELKSATFILQKIKPVAPIARLLLKYEKRILDFRKTRSP